ncbi:MULTISPECIES: exodeoxyribonuclease III [Larsenimonas]|uniref:Exodeoxyribonuclease III n=1 Tax=Larsenimonas suaedae TaxID=1851019 RepID=A0ABU1GWM5_9GAMM|nr:MULTISPECIES: exodeoxyribonuclease III [Larsenimonas]MCM2973337.1 exodeoxyribonuclease III [Larsenimonas suaedae]MCM5705098.1 exodeoxyribonuclease III [Larsenimonas salina]MDR5896230.1 exodeoxyribonuclease III [Larsenimonas suaedae]
MKIASINVNGIRGAVERGLLDWIAEQDADVICIQNLKEKSFEFEEALLYPSGYEGYFLDAEEDGVSGVGIYCKQIPKAIMYGLGFEQCDNEGRFLQADYDKFSVVSFLMPEEPHAKQRFITQYTEYLTKLSRKRREYILCGTWNIAHKTIDLAHWADYQGTPGFRPEERAFMDQVFGPLGFIDTFREIKRDGGHYTYWPKLDSDLPRQRQDGWRLDYQVVGPNLQRTIKNAWVDTNATFSEHAPLIVEYDLPL